MKSIAIIGIGSPYGADQTGWQLVEILKQDPALQALSDGQIKFVSCEHPGLVLLDYIADADYVILLDAVEGGRRGNLVRVEKQQLLDNAAQLSTHNLGVKEVLVLGDKLDSLSQHIDLIGIEVGDTSVEYQLDPKTVMQVKSLVNNTIQEYIAQQ
jgi:hydrogenase maturation protease